MCLAPCFAGCTKAEYDVEVERLLETLASTGSALIHEIEREREAASEALDFEHAAALHKRAEKASAVLRTLPEITRKIDDLNVVILQRGAQEKTIIVFPVLGGILQEPIFLRFAELSSEPKSVESILRAGLDKTVVSNETLPIRASEISNAPPQDVSVTQTADERRQRFGLHEAPPELSEQLCLIARWFYSNPRDGEIFFREADWPYRRILRACSRLSRNHSIRMKWLRGLLRNKRLPLLANASSGSKLSQNRGASPQSKVIPATIGRAAATYSVQLSDGSNGHNRAASRPRPSGPFAIPRYGPLA